MGYTKEQAMALTNETERVEYIAQQFAEQYTGDTLLAMARYANGYDGSFEWADTFDLDDAAALFNGDVYEAVRATVYGDVRNVLDPVRFNAYGNLETVTEYDLECMADTYADEIAEWYVWHYETEHLYQDEIDVMGAWEAMDDKIAL